MPPVRTLLFFVPLVKALRPSTTPAKQLSTASNMKALVASQKAAGKERQCTSDTRPAYEIEIIHLISLVVLVVAKVVETIILSNYHF